MVRYELKKIFGSWGGKIALVLLAAVVVISCCAAVSGLETTWIDDQGQHETGPAAVRKIRAARKEWAGPLDTERLTAAIQENQRISATPEANSDDIAKRDAAFGWKRGIHDIRYVVNDFLSSGFQEYDYYLADRIPLERLSDLYGNRVKLLKEFLYEEGSNANARFTEQEKQWLIEQYQALETPMEYDYFLGWRQLTETSSAVIMLMSLVLGYLVAGIFSNEFKWKTDSIYFSSTLGRTVNTRAKILAGFLLVTAVYWGCMLAYTLFTLAYLGIDGWNCPIQLMRWKCFYNITFLEDYLLIVLGGYLGNLFSAFLAMWISAKTRTAVISVTMPFVLVFLPSFLENYLQTADSAFLSGILGLLPDRLLQISNVISYFDLYQIGGKVVGSIPIQLAVYPILCVLLLSMMYRTYKGTQLA